MRAALKRTFVNWKDYAIAAGIALLLLALWELSARSAWINPLIFPPPSRIAASLVDLAHYDLFDNVAVSLKRFLSGVVLGSIPGILAGLLIGWSPRVRRIIDPFIAAIHPLPKIVLFPL
ncbi:MAG: NitT/TauT family transport system permease protein, partial [Acidobacteriota bacterium]|nr:NitT/TauT family transport system permease protein [Acidobacteriota bacterium]